MLPELHQLLALATFAQTENVTIAAESLHVAQPALSRKLKVLEERVGPLFTRARGRKLLTERGQAIASEAADIIARVHAFST
jgi:LysR family glycine cleavage system transcriptional activator